MFQFPGLTSMDYAFRPPMTPSGCPVTPGFPIRTSPDQCAFDHSPGLFAAYHVLHRLCTPRHPPCTLNSLTTFMKACDASANRRAPNQQHFDQHQTSLTCINAAPALDTLSPATSARLLTTNSHASGCSETSHDRSIELLNLRLDELREPVIHFNSNAITTSPSPRKPIHSFEFAFDASRFPKPYAHVKEHQAIANDSTASCLVAGSRAPE
jgi:hypothetical protein